MRRLADVLEAVSGTTSKLQKIDLLAAYLQSLNDEELRIACTYLTGAPFPPATGGRSTSGGRPSPTRCWTSLVPLGRIWTAATWPTAIWGRWPQSCAHARCDLALSHPADADHGERGLLSTGCLVGKRIASGQAGGHAVGV